MDHYACPVSYKTNHCDETYHHTPIYDPADIVCLGSDAEETPEERQLKRERYEMEAQRIARGRLPVLQSARLQGPFSKDTGWTNPWRSRTKRKTEEDWWQPGSENMLFTRANVMKRAASHGLGYLTPAEALKWCKATAQAEAEAATDAKIRNGLVMKSVEGDNADSSEDELHGSSLFEGNNEATANTAAHSQGHLDISVARNHSKTPHGNGGSKASIKRPADSLWLKGSYVSKRARWEDSSVPSPTPEILERHQQRQQNFSKTEVVETRRSTKSSRLALSFPDISRDGQQCHKDIPTDTSLFVTTRSMISEPPNTSRPNLDEKQFQHAQVSPVRPDDIDELQDDSQPSSLGAVSQSSMVKSKRHSTKLVDRSSSDLEPDDLIVVTPRKKGTPAAQQTRHREIRRDSSSKQYSLPKLPRDRSSSHPAENSAIYTENNSFITDVAPSSRDLEEFQFKKKRRPNRSENLVVEDDTPENVQTKDEHDNSTLTKAASQPPETQDSIHNIKSIPMEIDGDEDWQTDAGIPQGITAERKTKNDPNHEECDSMLYDIEPTLMEDDGDNNWETTAAVSQRLMVESYAEDDSMLEGPGSKSDIEPTLMEDDGDDDWDTTAAISQQPMSASNTGGNIPVEEHFSPTPRLSGREATESPKRSTDSEKSDTSWDKLEDGAQTVSSPDVPRSPHSTSSPDATKLSDSSSAESEEGHGQTVLQFSAEASTAVQDQEVIRPHTVTEVTRKGQFSQLSIMDMSTQSFNTTPSRSLRSPERLRASRLRKSILPEEDGSQAAEDDSTTENDKIQLNLSQLCPSSSHESNSDQSHRHEMSSSALPDDSIDRRASLSISTPVMENGVARFDTATTQHHVSAEIALARGLANPDEPVFQKQPLQNRPSLNVEATSTESSHEAGQSNTGGTAIIPHASDGEPPIVEAEAKPVVSTSAAVPAPNATSEDSWEGCGPQSPWAIEIIKPLPAQLASKPSPQKILKDDFLEEHHYQRSNMPGSDLGVSIADEEMTRPGTPGSKPCENFTTSSSSPGDVSAAPVEVLSDTQVLVKAAIQNPWASNRKGRPSGIARKRVSFGPAPTPGILEPSPREESPTATIFPSPPPPSQQHLHLDEDYMHDETPAMNSFERHFNAAKMFKRILPETRDSQPAGSPAIGAQAEAFLAADREVSTEPKPTKNSKQVSSRHKQPWSDASNNEARWSRSNDDDTRLMDSPFAIPGDQRLNGSAAISNFDMEDALGEAGEFLADWSVEAELKEAKETEQKSRLESNGYTRRRLFGLL